MESFKRILEETKTEQSAKNFAAFLMAMLDVYFQGVNENLGEEVKSKLVLAFMGFIGDKFDELKILPIDKNVSIDKDTLEKIIFSQEGKEHE